MHYKSAVPNPPSQYFEEDEDSSDGNPEFDIVAKMEAVEESEAAAKLEEEKIDDDEECFVDKTGC